MTGRPTVDCGEAVVREGLACGGMIRAGPRSQVACWWAHCVHRRDAASGRTRGIGRAPGGHEQTDRRQRVTPHRHQKERQCKQ